MRILFFRPTYQIVHNRPDVLAEHSSPHPEAGAGVAHPGHVTGWMEHTSLMRRLSARTGACQPDTHVRHGLPQAGMRLPPGGYRWTANALLGEHVSAAAAAAAAATAAAKAWQPQRVEGRPSLHPCCSAARTLLKGIGRSGLSLCITAMSI